MTKTISELETTNNPIIPHKIHYSKQQQRTIKPTSYYSPKFSIYILATCVTLFILFQIQSLHTPDSSSSWAFIHQWQKSINTSLTFTNCTQELDSMSTKLRHAVTFLPLKDLRFAQTAQQGHTWFMSSMYDTHVEGEVQYQHFPSESSKGRLLCLMGRDRHDGMHNSYALAWPDSLPNNATFMKGLTFVSYNHYNYDNIWHGLSAMVPFVAWHRKNGCALPARWILYHWAFDEVGDDGPACFEEAVVMRHNEGGMSRERRIEVYDLLRCKARMACNVSLEGRGVEVSDRGVPVIGMTMFMRTGPRSFRNESAVVRIFERECAKVDACRFMVAYSNNLTFWEQVKLMSLTDILVSPHGAQLTNTVPHGQKQQRDGVLPQRMVKTSWCWSIRLPLDR
ncbi:hypothetical protein L1049_000006 [Liquidambar formosana]|uniref:Glycosyltransferase 61 catalytic domain-containing protein n=1 Tax=Liquidambar formosana TaxID=63359 RepID=A0AAP0R2G1_LIQFO